MAIAKQADGVGVVDDDMEADHPRQARESATTLRAASGVANGYARYASAYP
jgi:hypothetical protein